MKVSEKLSKTKTKFFLKRKLIIYIICLSYAFSIFLLLDKFIDYLLDLFDKRFCLGIISEKPVQD